MDLQVKLRARLATQPKSVRKSNLRLLASTCVTVWPGLSPDGPVLVAQVALGTYDLIGWISNKWSPITSAVLKSLCHHHKSSARPVAHRARTKDPHSVPPLAGWISAQLLSTQIQASLFLPSYATYLSICLCSFFLVETNSVRFSCHPKVLYVGRALSTPVF